MIENILNENDLAGEIDYIEVKKKVNEIRRRLDNERKKLLTESRKTFNEFPAENNNKNNIKIENDKADKINIKNEREKNEEHDHLIEKEIDLLRLESQNQDDLKLYQEKNLALKNKKLKEDEEKFKNNIIEQLITELGKLMAIQKKNDKLLLYKSPDHGLDIALDVYEKMTREKFLEEFHDELEMLKILFPHTTERKNRARMETNETKLDKSFEINHGKFKSDNLLEEYNNIIDDKLFDKPRRLTTVEKKSNEITQIKKFSDSGLKGQGLDSESFTKLKNVMNQSEEYNKDKSVNDIAKHPNIALIKSKIGIKFYQSMLNNKINLDKPKDRNFFEYIYYKFQKAIDKILLIDLASSSVFKPNNIFEVLLYWIYSKIEYVIIVVFIINMCVDSSVISMIYPITYFGYGLLEYPFTNKYYWKTLIVYSLVTITLKLVYQFPFFCGYPFLSIFNPLNENYCEPYNLTETDFLDNFEYFLGLRKYNGEYSYPKNAGLLSGILWDIVILFLLLCNRSLLKSKGIWNFIDIHKEFTKVPVFLNGKSNSVAILTTENQENEINQNKNSIFANNKDNDIIKEEKNIDIEHNMIKINILIKNKIEECPHNPNNPNLCQNENNLDKFQTSLNEFSENLSKFLKIFFQRLVPELYYKDNLQISKPGVDYYPHTFACLLIILIYTLLFFGSITGRNGQSFSDILDKQQFSKDIVWTTIIIIFIIVGDRIIYKYRSVNTDFIFDRLNIRKKSSKNNNPISNTEEKNKSLIQNNINEKPNSSDKNLNVSTNNNHNNYNSNFSSLGRDHSNFFNQYFEQNTDVDYSNIALVIKLILHYSLLMFTHYFIFIKMPLITRIYFFQNGSLIILYVLCCLYFYLSSLQIKYGFPLITKGQYFASSTSLYNRIAFKIYRNVPFLYELRAILDWTITKTSLDLFQWFKMEDAYANLYEVKCDMVLRKDRKKGEDRWWFEKFSWGFCFFLFLMFILILPMILFSSFNPNLVENKVIGGKFSVNLELKNPELDTTLFTLNLFQVSTIKINRIKNPSQYTYLKNVLIPQVDDVEERKIQKVKIINYSQLDWILSPPTIRELLTNLEKKTECFINIEWEFRRDFPPNNRNIVGMKSNQLSRDQISMLRYIIFSLKTHQKPEKFKLDIKGKNLFLILTNIRCFS